MKNNKRKRAQILLSNGVKMVLDYDFYNSNKEQVAFYSTTEMGEEEEMLAEFNHKYIIGIIYDEEQIIISL